MMYTQSVSTKQGKTHNFLIILAGHIVIHEKECSILCIININRMIIRHNADAC